MMKNLNKLSCSAAAVLLASCIAAPVMAGQANMKNGFSVGVSAQIGASLLDGEHTSTDSSLSKVAIGAVTALPEVNLAWGFGATATNAFAVTFNVIPMKGKIEGTAGGDTAGTKYEAEVHFPMTLMLRASHALEGGGSVFASAGMARAEFKHEGNNSNVVFATKHESGPVLEVGTFNDLSSRMVMETSVGYRQYGELNGSKNGADNAKNGSSTWKAKPKQVYGKLGIRMGF